MNPNALSPWLEFWTFPSTVINVMIGCVLLAGAAGLIGCFAYLRKQALIGDALAHAALPGVCVAFIAIISDRMISAWASRRKRELGLE